MENYTITVGTILAMLLGSLVAVYLGSGFVGLIFFVLALTPLPLKTAYWLRDMFGDSRETS